MSAAVPVLPADDSMLSRKFGREVANYFSGSPLNRVSFLRSSPDFLRAAFIHPSARFLLVDNLAPLTTGTAPPRLAWLPRADIEPLTGADVFTLTEEESIKRYNSALDPAPIVLFLGIDHEKKLAALSPASASTSAEPVFAYQTFTGSPYFAVDVTPRVGAVADKARALIERVTTQGLAFDTNARSMRLIAEEAAMYAAARSLLDWNARNPFCAGCGQPTLSVNAGTKRVCPPTDLAGVPPAATGSDSAPEPRARADCPTRKGLSNLCFPRTDPTVIMAIVSADGQRLLLGRNKRFPPHWYSTLAGFLEPGESVEEAVRREAWEESGVTVGRVVMHSSQPWPFPASLMLGAIGQALPGDGEKIFLGHDPELEDARWYTLDEVRHALKYGTSALDGPAGSEYKEGDLRLPPSAAIANQLITAVVEGFLEIDQAKI